VYSIIVLMCRAVKNLLTHSL